MTTDATIPEALLPKGVKDFLPNRAAKIEFLQKTLLELFHRWGFRPVLPPALENLDVLEQGLGSGLREKTFRFDDRQSGRLVAFPPDITPQVARIVATRMQNLPLPLRLCYSGRVLRHTEQQAGKDREIFQAGVELIGLPNAEADAEMIAMAVEALQDLGVPEFTIDIGQVEFFRGIMNDLDLDKATLAALRDAIGRKDTSGLRQLLEPLAVSDRQKEELLALPRLFGGREVLDRADLVVHTPSARRALSNLADVLQVLETYEVDPYVTFDLGEIRGLDYHTGITFQGFLPGLGRAVCSGGRYDNLTARYGRPLAATGFTFNLLNLLFALDKELQLPAARTTDVLLFQQGDNKSRAQQLARALRRQGYSAARDNYPRGLEETLAYAGKMDFHYVMIIGSEQDSVKLVRVADGHERQISIDEIEAGNLQLDPHRS
ncbi:ATP phosphoribosyltransferase regulatory subunit [Geothermobacter hydrogeniphilus]|uniref:ATP phosphoribosyltransferase regulatory subunit n=1 Tax=Geothermobacter hydrogeniphilus TaxID=1969733 RepID=A0A1X0YAK0_9BACT|nr:ATP phosphoribosyltransferase regulatory subunit [Geothermobacter hydrogeniphilus]ORJ62147.1 ATP phosphoribosyltransferase regulatory subunit [Geothermobacter hydrogeniphilus]